MIRLNLEKLRRHSSKTRFPKIGLIPILKSACRRCENRLCHTYFYFNAYENYEFIYILGILSEIHSNQNKRKFVYRSLHVCMSVQNPAFFVKYTSYR